MRGGEIHNQQASYCSIHDSLLRSEYETRQLILSDLPGIWKFSEWLPVKGILELGAGPTTYKSKMLAKELGLEELYISFNGYWPEKGAYMDTCTFKDLEAAPTIRRLLDYKVRKALVVASAGNTARAFARVCSDIGFPLILVVPVHGLDRIWMPVEKGKSIFIIGVEGDYYDAISLSERLVAHGPFMAEGGAKNIARRDGMGTVMLDAAFTIKKLPKHYFQAIGSGTGGIAAWEASLRLINDGRFGQSLPHLHLAQNIPCAPIFNTINNENISDDCPRDMFDDVLFNRKPPLHVGGGILDALRSTGGLVYGISNKEAEIAKRLFESLEGIDIVPAAAIAVAALLKAVDTGVVSKNESVLLNITGGGEALLRRDKGIKIIEADVKVRRDEDPFSIVRMITEALGGSIFERAA